MSLTDRSDAEVLAQAQPVQLIGIIQRTARERDDLEAKIANFQSREFAEAVERERAIRGAGDDEYNTNSMQDAIAAVLNAPKTRAQCCGIIYEHGMFTTAKPCHDCPTKKGAS